MATPVITSGPALEGDTVEEAIEFDSAVGSENDNDSTRSASLTSSITGYKYENGRRYHAYREGAYYLPNDEAEQARLDLMHHIYTLSLNGALYLAPLSKDITRCLDFGTGTGIWAIDFADEFPNCEVIGTDLSPIQPTWVPPNLRFFVDDVEADWTYTADEAFDFIHGRSMGGGLADWKLLFDQIFKHLKPGGWCEMHEYESWYHSNNDLEAKNWPNVKTWIDLCNEASDKIGKELNMGPQIKDLMANAGMVDIQEKTVKIPIGPWAKGQKEKEMGVLQREHILECVDSYTPALLTRVLGWSLEETQILMAKCKKEVKDPQNQMYVNFIFTFGKKP